jgi:hypothetical protein
MAARRDALSLSTGKTTHNTPIAWAVCQAATPDLLSQQHLTHNLGSRRVLVLWISGSISLLLDETHNGTE